REGALARHAHAHCQGAQLSARMGCSQVQGKVRTLANSSGRAPDRALARSPELGALAQHRLCQGEGSGMSKQRRRKGHLPPFVPLIRTTLASPAWKQLSFGARCLYVVLRSFLRVDSLNNGKVFRSYRDAAADLGTKSTRSVQRWFRELEYYGFIVKTTGACLGVDGDGIAAHWRLTEYASYDAKGTQIA